MLWIKYAHGVVMGCILKGLNCNMLPNEQAGNTPLHAACANCRLDVIRFLVEDCGAKLEAKTLASLCVSPPATH